MEGEGPQRRPTDLSGMRVGGGEIDTIAADRPDRLTGDGVGDQTLTGAGHPGPGHVALDCAHPNSRLNAKLWSNT